ncbi:hypothetical protein [Promicromonospora sp. NPDC057488]|uniref:hypothetical protein n=1 Tax=Promicromonospora sp. NPDC057488 TaxID=3346147 RepID=UPI0036733D11
MRSRFGAALLAALVGATVLSGCTNDDDACARAFETAALAVDEVATANFSCTSGFEHGSQGGVITLSVDSEDQALPVIEKVYRGFASSGELDDAWTADADFFLKNADTANHEEIIDDSALGIEDDPLIFTLRDRYGIRPPDVD